MAGYSMDFRGRLLPRSRWKGCRGAATARFGVSYSGAIAWLIACRRDWQCGASPGPRLQTEETLGSVAQQLDRALSRPGFTLRGLVAELV